MLMIYTKGKAGYHMEKSDILTASLPDANDETTDHGTIFDDVFRTIAQKMPQLLIPLSMKYSTLLTVKKNILNSCGTNIMKNMAL